MSQRRILSSCSAPSTLLRNSHVMRGSVRESYSVVLVGILRLEETDWAQSALYPRTQSHDHQALFVGKSVSSNFKIPTSTTEYDPRTESSMTIRNSIPRTESRMTAREDGPRSEFCPLVTRLTHAKPEIRYPVEEFVYGHHPFGEQVALIDKCIMDIKAVRDRYQTPARAQTLNGQSENDDDSDNSEIDPFDDFRSTRPANPASRLSLSKWKRVFESHLSSLISSQRRTQCPSIIGSVSAHQPPVTASTSSTISQMTRFLLQLADGSYDSGGERQIQHDKRHGNHRL